MYNKKTLRIPLVSLCLGVVLAIVLAACSGPTTSQAVPTVPPSQPAQATPVATSTPASQPVATPQAPLAPLQAIRMVDANNGWVLTTKNAVLKTSDGGRHWQDVTPQNFTSGVKPLSEFLTGQVAWLAGMSGVNQPITILHTSDGGASWQTTTINNVTGGFVAETLHFINTQQGWLVTANAEGMLHYTVNVYRTLDAGKTWTNVSGALRLTAPSGISFANPQLGWFGVQWPGPASQVEKTANGGQSWQQVTLPMPAGITSAQIGQTQTTAPVLIGANGILPVHIDLNSTTPQSRLVLYTTHDSGATWTANTLANFDSNDVYALDVQHVWAEAAQGNVLYASSDGGKTWSQLAQTPQHFAALSFADVHNGWAIDDAGNLYQTTSGGANWQKLS